MEIINDSLHSRRHNRYSWLEWEESQMVGKFINRPEREDIPENIKEQLIVELYSK
jgi:small subunit ribosomal protein S4